MPLGLLKVVGSFGVTLESLLVNYLALGLVAVSCWKLLIGCLLGLVKLLGELGGLYGTKIILGLGLAQTWW